MTDMGYEFREPPGGEDAEECEECLCGCPEGADCTCVDGVPCDGCFCVDDMESDEEEEEDE